MNENNYSDEEGDTFSSSSSDSLTNENNFVNFGALYQHKQIETLKYLRHALNENKSLKQRLEIVENELEKCQGFGSFLPLVDQATWTETNNEFQIEEEEEQEIQVVKEKNVNTEDKYCQSDFEMPKTNENISYFIIAKQTTEPDVLFQEITKIEKKEEKVEEKIKEKSIIITKVSKGCQSDDLTDKEKIKELNEIIQNLKLEHEAEVRNLKIKIEELSTKKEELNLKLQDMSKNLDTSNEKLSEYLKTNIKLSRENEELVPIKEKHDLLIVENEQLYNELQTKQNHLDASNKKFFELNESLNESLNLIEKQKSLIKNLEAENEKHLKEKHVICQQKINDLIVESNKYKEKSDYFELENRKLNETITDLNKQLEKYQSDLKNFNFKEFVSLKRELNALKQEKERQFANVVTMPNQNLNSQQQSPLPPIKPSKKNLFNFFN